MESKKLDLALEEIADILKHDAQAIIDEINHYKIEPLKSKKKINLQAFDSVIPFADDPRGETKEWSDLRKKSGVYIFLMVENFTRSKHFNNVYSGSSLNDLSKKIFYKDEVLYVGMTQSFLRRMHQHFAVDTKYNRTGSLKLGSENRKALLGYFKVYAFTIKEKYKKYYSAIGPVCESALHDALKPFVGRK